MLLTTFFEPTEGVYHVQADTQAFIQDRCLGKGTLYVTEDNLSWCDLVTGKGFSLDYPAISLHAVCKDTTHFPHECLFCMVEGPLEGEKEVEDDCGDEEDEPAPAELRFVPDDKVSLENMYTAICDCQVLHPDEQEQLEEEMAGYTLDNGEFYTGESEENATLTEEGQATLERLENTLRLPSQQEFLEMTNQDNGCVNGHEDADSGQFDDMED